MMYADNVCKYVELVNPHTYTFVGPCIHCQRKYSVKVHGVDLYRYRQGEEIQNAFPYLTPDQREFLMSGICGECFDKLLAFENA